MTATSAAGAWRIDSRGGGVGFIYRGATVKMHDKADRDGSQASARNTPARGQALGTKGGIEVVGRARGELSKIGSVHRDREEM